MNNLKLIFTLLVGIVFGIGFNSLFTGSAADPMKPSNIQNIRPKILDKEVKAVNKQFETQLDSLTQNSMVLNQNLQSSKLQVAHAKKQNKLLQIEVQSLVDNRYNTTDSTKQDNDCDSMQNKIVQLIVSDNFKDSLQEVVSMNVEQQLKNKDSTIDLLSTQTQQLKLSFNESIHNQDILYSQNRVFEKQFKRQKIKRKLRSVVTIVAAGFAGYYLLSH